MDIWVIPHHIRPVVSYDMIRKGRSERPKSGLDRLTLTEVGLSVFERSRNNGIEMKIRRANPPFPWEMAFSRSGVEIAHLQGHFIGPSTFRSIFRFRWVEDTEGSALARKLVDDLGRDPLHSEYWNMDTWSRFSRKTGLTRNEVLELNRGSLSLL